jgi:hypothetical protein
MADHPGAKESITADRTGALVAGGLVLLAVVGVATVFSETLAAAWSPAPTAPAAIELSAAPVPPSPAAGKAATAVGADGGAAPP